MYVSFLIIPFHGLFPTENECVHLSVTTSKYSRSRGTLHVTHLNRYFLTRRKKIGNKRRKEGRKPRKEGRKKGRKERTKKEKKEERKEAKEGRK